MEARDKDRFSVIFYFAIALSFLSSVKGICDPNGASLTGSSGSFTSPNYPNNYPSSTTCRWIITVPEDNRVKLTFHSFDLETCFISSSCTCDHVEIRDGSDGSSIELKEFCGGRTPGLTPVISSGRFMWIEFKSDSGTEKTGFNATYTADGTTPVESSSLSPAQIVGIVVGGVVFVVVVTVLIYYCCCKCLILECCCSICPI